MFCLAGSYPAPVTTPPATDQGRGPDPNPSRCSAWGGDLPPSPTGTFKAGAVNKPRAIPNTKKAQWVEVGCHGQDLILSRQQEYPVRVTQP